MKGFFAAFVGSGLVTVLLPAVHPRMGSPWSAIVGGFAAGFWERGGNREVSPVTDT